MMETENSDFFTIYEFANKLKTHPNTIRRAIKRGKINAINIGSGKKKLYRIPSTEIHRIALFDLKEMIKKIRDEDIDT